ncbi:hypothetical protein F7725_004940 [Dissostichus mawsoni]|uniref:Uncharacterized protein n=1 Tax=Dissostichus mawsoni TaxID=36200 RepID=A0A7J5XK66_DISMA|nr:hypothetical protein F7725_004940 [Dissostichus mawsoni]
MERLFLWSLRRQFTEDMKLEQLRIYQMLLSQARQPLLHHKPVLRPLMMLLASCSGANAEGGGVVEAELVLLLHQLCGSVGQQARDALLLIMTLSNTEQRVARHIAQNTYFCPAACYSEDWHCLDQEDWQQVPALVHFLHSGICSAVTKVSVEEVMTTTAYLDLFLRSVSDPALLHSFLSFILLHTHDGVHILDTLQKHFSSSSSFLLLLPSWSPRNNNNNNNTHLEHIHWPKAADVSDSVGFCRASDFLMDVNYLHYLWDARQAINSSIVLMIICFLSRACERWSSPYDGIDPPPLEYRSTVEEDDEQIVSQIKTDSPTSAFSPRLLAQILFLQETNP